MKVKPVVFRLYPERATLYARVQIWPTKAAMLAHLNSNRHPYKGNRFSRHVLGACSRNMIWHVSEKGVARRQPCFAVVNMFRARLTMQIVTHELFHATLAWGYRIGFPFFALDDDYGVTEMEERITHAHSELCRQFMVRANDAGLYPAAKAA
jgi:hypothetical protein